IEDADCRDLGIRRHLLAIGDELVVRHLGAHLRRRDPLAQVEELLDLWNRDRAPPQTLERAEDGGIRVNPDVERDDGDGREEGTAARQTDTVAEIADQIVGDSHVLSSVAGMVPRPSPRGLNTRQARASSTKRDTLRPLAFLSLRPSGPEPSPKP